MPQLHSMRRSCQARGGGKAGPAAVLATVLLVLAVGVGHAQIHVDTLRLGETPSCPNCSIRLRSVATIGEPDGEGALPSRPYDMARAGTGDFVLVTPEGGSEPPLRFGPDGRFRGRVGREGDGPGEYRRPMAVEIVGDSVFVVDGQSGRLTVSSLEGRVHRSAPLPPGAMTAARLRDGRLALNLRLAEPARAGHVVHLFGADGRWLRGVGTERTTRTPRRVTPDVRWLTAAPDGGLLVVNHLHRYRAELWDPTLHRVLVVTRTPPWFPAFEEPWNPTPTRPPMPRAMGGWRDGHRLWLVFHVPSPTWARGLGAARRGEGGREFYPVADEQRVYRTVVDVIDVRRGSLEMSAEVEGTVDLVLGGGLVGLIRESEAGGVVVRVARVELEPYRTVR